MKDEPALVVQIGEALGWTMIPPQEDAASGGSIMAMINAEEAFDAWLLKVELVAGGACLLVLLVCLTIAVILFAIARQKRE